MRRSASALFTSILIAIATSGIAACGSASESQTADPSGASARPTGTSPTGTSDSASSDPKPTATGRDPSGIPTAVDGQPVWIGLAAVVHAASTTDDTPFLVGGWFYDASAFTCSGGGSIGRDPSPLLTGCATVVGGNSPWSATFPGPQ